MGILAHRTDADPQPDPFLATDEDFHKYYSRFKIELLLADGNTLCHYGNEANVTVAQMMDGSVTEILLDAHQAFKDCLLFFQRYRPTISVAVIYRRNRNERRWYPVRTYGPTGTLLQKEEMKWKRHISRCTCQRRDNTIYITHVEVVSK